MFHLFYLKLCHSFLFPCCWFWRVRTCVKPTLIQDVVEMTAHPLQIEKGKFVQKTKNDSSMHRETMCQVVLACLLQGCGLWNGDFMVQHLSQIQSDWYLESLEFQRTPLISFCAVLAFPKLVLWVPLLSYVQFAERVEMFFLPSEEDLMHTIKKLANQV